MNSEQFRPLIESNSSQSNLETAPFESASQEAQHTIQHFSQLSQNSDELTHSLTTTLSSQGLDLPSEFSRIIQPLVKDVAWIVKQAQDLNPHDFVHITFPDTPKTTYKYVTQPVHNFLTRLRLLGIIPFEVIDRLEQQEIISIGASVGSSTLDQLVSFGLQKATLIDDGTLDPSNQPRMPIGSITHNGQSKTVVVVNQLYRRNPFGNYQARIGRLISDKDLHQANQDNVFFSQVITGNQIIIEAIDHLPTKVALRQWLRQYYPQTPIFMPTDVGINPFVSVEIGNTQPFFNQPQFSHGFPDTLLSPENALSAVYNIVQSNFPPDHQAQFLSIAAGLVPSWSQVPTSARESGAMTVKLILQYLRDETIESKNYTQQDISPTLMPYSEEDQQSILTVAQSLFSFS